MTKINVLHDTLMYVMEYLHEPVYASTHFLLLTFSFAHLLRGTDWPFHKTFISVIDYLFFLL